MCLGGGLTGLMNMNLDIITYAVSLIIKAVIMAARFSGRVRKRSLKRLAAMDADAKAKETGDCRVLSSICSSVAGMWA